MIKNLTDVDRATQEELNNMDQRSFMGSTVNLERVESQRVSRLVKALDFNTADW